MTNKGQATLEFALVFIIAAALILGLLSLGRWSRDNITARQSAFESSRVRAGSKDSPGEPAIPFEAKSPDEPYLFKR